MTAIRASLQREVFSPDDERLIAVVSVIRTKKKRSTFLCLTLSTTQPITAKLYLVKSEKEDVFVKKEWFFCGDIRQVDGINPRKPTPDLEIIIGDRLFKFTAASVEEKDAFVRQLYRISAQYIPTRKADFINLSLPVEETSVPSVSQENEDVVVENLVDYQPISAKEEADFRRLLARAELGIGQAEAFAAALTEQLHSLDGANMTSIMGSEQAVNELIALVDSALANNDALDAQLSSFDQLLSHVRERVELIEERDSVVNVQRMNVQKLQVTIESLLAAIDVISPEQTALLHNASLTDPASIARCATAARALTATGVGTLPEGLEQMIACRERSESIQRLIDHFVDKLVAHLSALFHNLLELSEETNQWHDLSLRKHSQRHHALMPFGELVAWMKTIRPQAYRIAIQRYTDSTRVLYKTDFDRFFRLLMEKLDTLSKYSVVENAKTSSSDRRSSTVDRQQYVQLVETMCGELEPVVASEQKFAQRFFAVSSVMGGGKAIATEKQQHDEIRRILAPLFDHLNDKMDAFAQSCARMHPSIVLLLFKIMSTKAMAVQDNSLYWSVIFGRLVVMVKRQFDTYMESETLALADVRITKRTRIGILDALDRFKELADVSESVFVGTDRRADLDRWYLQLVSALFDAIEKSAASANSKSPASIVKLENYHRLYCDISELKIACLDAMRKEAKRRYQESIDIYVREYMGRPLDKIHQFFEQVETAIADGVKPEEISFQQQFGRSDLKKVISSYPGREVKKGLEQLYKKLEKHLVDHSALLQVVWRNMQDEFLKQIKHYQQITGQCYPNSRMDLEFTIQDVLQYFSEIAQQH